MSLDTRLDFASHDLAGTDEWTQVCALDQLVPGAGAAALVDGHQVALFRTGADQVHALANRDPFSGAQVLSRGLLGESEGRPYVASPLHKQRFDLATGRCLDPEGTVATYPVLVRAGQVLVALPTSTARAA